MLGDTFDAPPFGPTLRIEQCLESHFRPLIAREVELNEEEELFLQPIPTADVLNKSPQQHDLSGRPLL